MVVSPLRSTPQRRLLAALLIGGSGSAIVLSAIRRTLRGMRKHQRLLVERAAGVAPDVASGAPRKVAKVGVDRVFVNRLRAILRVCIPGALSTEAAMVVCQTVFLVLRTLLTDRIADLEGRCGEAVTTQSFGPFLKILVEFALTALPAAIINSLLKTTQTLIGVAFRRRLTSHLHKRYVSNRAYYVASALGGLSHADQRITEEVEKFCHNISELYSYTFKPILDVVLFTRSLASIIGYRGQLSLYLYFVVAGGFLKSISPPLSLMTAQEAALSADFRAAHGRLANKAEEVAFNDPPAGAAERMALDATLDRLLTHNKLSAFQKMFQQFCDGYLVKYTASIIGLAIFALPLYLKPLEMRGTQSEITRDYIRTMRLMMNTSTSIGQLVLVYKRITTLAGHTARVSELMEQVASLAKPQGQLETFRSTQEMSMNSEASRLLEGLPSPKLEQGDIIEFENVAILSPDGSPLVRDLNFKILPGKSVIIQGPNGCGKSSLLRVLAELWPLQGGTITRPSGRDIFYLSQRPYVFTGSLRQQVLYPRYPSVVGASSAGKTDDDSLRECLRNVELEHLIERVGGWDSIVNWDGVLSGGEKQRMAMARLLHHRPKYAVLDECTSAVSADGEVKLYQKCIDAEITMLSIAHRPAVTRFHDAAIVFEGSFSADKASWTMEKLSGRGNE